MKQKISISMDDETLSKIETKMKGSLFRNRSHFIEFAVSKYLEDE